MEPPIAESVVDDEEFWDEDEEYYEEEEEYYEEEEEEEYDEDEDCDEPEIIGILKKRTTARGEAEYFVRFKGSSKNAWLPETQVARRARLLLNSFTRSSPQSPPSMKRDNNTPSQQTRLVADPVALDDVKLLVMRDHLGHHGMQMIGAKLHARHSGARCGLCNKLLLGQRKASRVVVFIQAASRMLVCFAKNGGATHVFHEWCANEWLFKTATECVCAAPTCVEKRPLRDPKNVATIKLGFDLGGVLIDRFANDISGFNFLEDDPMKYLGAAAVPGAFEEVKRFIDVLGPESVFIVSGRTMMSKKLKWLFHHHFFEITGFMLCNAFFVERWPEKTAICKEVGITHFIDDKLMLVTAMRGVVPHLFFFQTPEKAKSEEGHSVIEYQGEFVHCTSWRRLYELIIAASTLKPP